MEATEEISSVAFLRFVSVASFEARQLTCSGHGSNHFVNDWLHAERIFTIDFKVKFLG